MYKLSLNNYRMKNQGKFNKKRYVQSAELFKHFNRYSYRNRIDKYFLIFYRHNNIDYCLLFDMIMLLIIFDYF